MAIFMVKNSFAIILMALYFVKQHMQSFSISPLIIKALPIWYLASLMSTAPSSLSSYAKTIGWGLLFSSAGDIILEIETPDPNYFLGGLVAFLIAHLFYIKAFWLSPMKLRIGALIPIAIFYGILMYIILPNVETELKIPVMIYAGIITTMVYSALHRFLSSNVTEISAASKACGLLGALVFLSSDTILALDRFVGKMDHGKTMVMITYYTGQFFIATSALLAVKSAATKRNK